MVPQKMDLLYLLLPIIGAFILLFTVCCCGRKVKQILHFPKEVAIGGRAREQVPDSDDGSSWGSDDLDTYVRDPNDEINFVTEETPLASNQHQRGEHSGTYLMDELIAGNLMESNRSVTECSPDVSLLMRNCYKERSHSMQELSDDSGCFIHEAVDRSRTCLNSGGLRRSVSVCICDMRNAQLDSSIDSCWRQCDDCDKVPHFKQNDPLHVRNSYSSSDFEIGSQPPSNSHVCVVPIMHHRDETDTPVER